MGGTRLCSVLVYETSLFALAGAPPATVWLLAFIALTSAYTMYGPRALPRPYPALLPFPDTSPALAALVRVLRVFLAPNA